VWFLQCYFHAAERESRVVQSHSRRSSSRRRVRRGPFPARQLRRRLNCTLTHPKSTSAPTITALAASHDVAQDPSSKASTRKVSCGGQFSCLPPHGGSLGESRRCGPRKRGTEGNYQLSASCFWLTAECRWLTHWLGSIAIRCQKALKPKFARPQSRRPRIAETGKRKAGPRPIGGGGTGMGYDLSRGRPPTDLHFL
jgi:hypothetical protein